MMNLQDLMDVSDNKELVNLMMLTDNYSKENLEIIQQQLSNKANFRLSILKTPFSEFYGVVDFRLDLVEISKELDKLCNKSYAIYDTKYRFVGISDSEVDGMISLKRNAHSVFLLLVYGFSKVEIMEVLHISRSYISLVMKTIKEKCQCLLCYHDEINASMSSITKF